MLQEATDRGVIDRLSHLTKLTAWDSRPNFSTGYLTRAEVAEHKWTLPRGTRHAFLELALASPSMRIFGLHLSAWFSNWSERRRRIEIESLVTEIREHQDGFHLIVGDFNALAPGEALRPDRMPHWIRAMVWLSGRDIARHTIQYMIDERYVDVWRAANSTGDGYTFPTWDPHVRLDYIFIPERFRACIRRCEVFYHAPEGKTASDHYPLLFDFEVPQ